MGEVIFEVRDLPQPICEHPDCEERAAVEISLLGGGGDVMRACERHSDYCKRALLATR